MSSKYAVFVIVVIAAMLLIGPGRTTVQADTDLVTDIEYSPDPPVAGENLTVTCKLSDETDVDNVVLNMCSSAVCFPPKLMEKVGGVWTATSSDVTEVEEYHFNITVHFENGTKEWTDDIYFDAVSTDLETDKLEHVPAKVRVGDEVDVYAELADDTDVKTVSLFVCQGDLCFAPKDMTKLTNGTYHAQIGPFDSTEKEIKYNVTVEYNDGHKAWTVDMKFTPEKKSDGNGDDDNGIIPALGAVAVLAVLTALAMTARGARRG